MDRGPLAGDQLLAALRGAQRSRPPVVPSLGPRLRARLEEAAAPAADGLPSGVTVSVTKGHLGRVLACEAHLVASLAATEVASAPMVRGRLLDQLFSLVVLGIPLSEDPVVDALAAAAAAGDDLGEQWDTLGAEERQETQQVVRAQAADLAERWPLLPPSALVRLQEPLRVELAAGQVVLSGRADVVLGLPGAHQVGTTLVDIKSGTPRYQDVHDAWWYALLETLRHQVAPFQTGNYYLGDGGLSLEVVTAEGLERQADRVADGLTRMIALAAGRRPATTPSNLCPRCPALPTCPPGRAFVQERRPPGGQGTSWTAPDDDGEPDDDEDRDDCPR